MNYSLKFGQIAADVPWILAGTWPTLWITFTVFFVALPLGLCLALMKLSDKRLPRLLASGWIVLTINSPLFVVLFFLFNGLPAWGILLNGYQVTLIGFIAITSGYLAEIQRGGIESVRRAELDAAETLGMSRFQTVRYVIAPHVLKIVYPSLANFFIFVMLGTSMASLVGVDELTGRAIEVVSRTLRSLEVFSLVAVTYVVLTFVASISLAVIGRLLFRVKARIF